MPRLSARALHILLMLAFTLAICELMAAAYFRLAGERSPLPDPHRYLAEEKPLKSARRYFNAELGWQTPYKTELGERVRSHHYDRPLAVTFGDSFVHGDEVEHHETWQEEISALLQADVYNFASGAYGTDQALLRFERDFPRRPAPLVVFGFISEDLGRNMGVYWRFRYPEMNLSLTKPRFRLRDDELELLPNPVGSYEELRAGLTDVDFLRKIGVDDWWYNRFELPEVSFPHLRFFFLRNFWRGAFHRKTYDELWYEDEPKRIFELILARVQRGAFESGATAHFVHFPIVREVVLARDEGTFPYPMDQVRAMCQREELRCHFPLEEWVQLEKEELEKMFVRGLWGGHYSPEGHRWMAQYLLEKVDFQGALEEVSSPPSEVSEVASSRSSKAASRSPSRSRS